MEVQATSNKIDWWNAKPGKVSNDLLSYVNNLNDKQRATSRINERHLRLYGNNEFIVTDQGANYSRTSVDRLTLNIVQVIVDTAVNIIGSVRPKATFLTNEGSWKEKKEAKKLEHFSYGQLYQGGLYDKASNLFKDAAVLGTTCVKSYFKDDNSWETERIFPENIIVDEVETLFDSPKTLVERRAVSKTHLAGLFPEFEREIKNAPAAYHPYLYREAQSDMTWIYEGFFLSSNPSSSGRHVLCIEGATFLDDQDFKKDYLPYNFWKYQERMVGFWGEGIAERLTPLQIEINRNLKVIQRIVNVGCIPKVFLEVGSSISKAHLNNELLGIIPFKGQPPVPGSLAPVPVDLMNYVFELYQKAFEIIGISASTAQSTVPSKLMASGKALREYSDIQSQRFQSQQQSWEKFFVDIAKTGINQARDHYEEGKLKGEKREIAFSSPGSGSFQRVPWNEINLKQDSYVMQVYPTNLFSMTPHARYAEVMEGLQIGLFTIDEAKSYLQYPDFKRQVSLTTAKKDDLEATFDDIIYEGKFSAPDTMQDLETGISLAQAYYLKYKHEGVPPENLELLNSWISRALFLTRPEAEESVVQETDGESYGQLPSPEISPVQSTQGI